MTSLSASSSMGCLDRDEVHLQRVSLADVQHRHIYAEANATDKIQPRALHMYCVDVNCQPEAADGRCTTL